MTDEWFKRAQQILDTYSKKQSAQAVGRQWNQHTGEWETPFDWGNRPTGWIGHTPPVVRCPTCGAIGSDNPILCERMLIAALRNGDVA